MLNQEVFHGQTWNCRKSSHPFLMNWYCYAIGILGGEEDHRREFIGFLKEYEKR